MGFDWEVLVYFGLSLVDYSALLEVLCVREVKVLKLVRTRVMGGEFLKVMMVWGEQME